MAAQRQTVKPVYSSPKQTDDQDDDKFSDRLRAVIRHFDPKSDRAFARRVGVSTTSLQNYLKDQTPRLDQAAAICKATGVSLTWLATGKTETEVDVTISLELLQYQLANLPNSTPQQRQALLARVDFVREEYDRQMAAAER